MGKISFGTMPFYQMVRPLLGFIILVLFFYSAFFWDFENGMTKGESVSSGSSYWLILQRKSNVEYLYYGLPGDKSTSSLVKTFLVKTGVAGEKPTPLPELLGREYSQIVDKRESLENEETAPYFLTLDIPVSEYEPYGPEPYLECDGQCNWTIPGYFGLHGVNGDNAKLSDDDLGSSGCIRHSNEDITYLYNTLELTSGEVRYYIEDI